MNTVFLLKLKKPFWAFFCIGIQIALWIVFIVVGSSIRNNSSSKDFFHVLLYQRHAFFDGGFTEQAIQGACLAFAISLSEKKCNFHNPQFRKHIGFSFPGSMSDEQKILKHINYFYKTRGTRNYIIPGYTFTNFIVNQIDNFASQKINVISLGAEIHKYYSGSSWPENLWQILFQQQYAGYHAGLYAGAYALKHPEQFPDSDLNRPGRQINFGSLGGIYIPAIINYALGFKLGLQVIQQNQNIFSVTSSEPVELKHTAFEIVGGFDPSDKGFGPATKQLAQKFYEEEKTGAIFVIANPLVPLVQKQAADKSGKYQYWVIGVDYDAGLALNSEKEDSPLLKGHILTSAILKIDVVVQEAVQEILQGLPGRKWLVGTINEQHKYATIPDRFLSAPFWKKQISSQEWRKLGDWSAEIQKLVQHAFNPELSSVQKNQFQIAILELLRGTTPIEKNTFSRIIEKIIV